MAIKLGVIGGRKIRWSGGSVVMVPMVKMMVGELFFLIGSLRIQAVKMRFRPITGWFYRFRC